MSPPTRRMVWFGRRLIGREISFTEPHQSTWRLDEKVREKYVQEDEQAFKKIKYISQAWAVFLCTNVQHPDVKGVMKIHMQIPYNGSEYDPPALRSEQATEKLSGLAWAEREALQLLTKNGCASTPELLSFKQEEQGNDMWVPGGYILYMLMSRLPGERGCIICSGALIEPRGMKFGKASNHGGSIV
ncbi:hypothetical protein M432DRAFT_61931 [Thermoascus aurantiacus ATCC 26904]